MKPQTLRKLVLLSLVSFLMLTPARIAFAITTLTSNDWAGYVITFYGVTAISASWTVPVIQCTATGATNAVTQGLAVWIGFDGWGTDMNVPEQIGTMSYCLNGSPTYWSWEKDPSISPTPNTNNALQAIPNTPAGDQITASINYLGNNEYQLSLKDSTQDESRVYTVIIKNAPRESAEWILEAFQNNMQQQVTLPTFNPVTFSDCSASVNNVVGSITQNNAYPLDMVDSNNNVIAAPQNLNQAGTSFQVAEAG